jgi:hypothetical protein
VDAKYSERVYVSKQYIWTLTSGYDVVTNETKTWVKWTIGHAKNKEEALEKIDTDENTVEITEPEDDSNPIIQ